MSGRSTMAKLRLGMKATELILSCVCIGLNEHAHVHDCGKSLYSITFGGYVIICGGLLLGFITQEYICIRVDLLFTMVGMSLNIVAGSFLIHNNMYDIPKACGSLAIINGALMMFDAICMYRTTDEYTPHN